MKLLHKSFSDYTMKELDKIKKEKCMKCEHFHGTKKETRNGRGDLSCMNVCQCDYIGDTGHPRVCRPEICPYSDVGGGVKLNLKKGEQYINFQKYCMFCKYNALKEDEDPCKDCLMKLKGVGTDQPLYFERRDMRS